MKIRNFKFNRLAILMVSIISVIASPVAFAANPHDDGDFFARITGPAPVTPRASNPMPTALPTPITQKPLYHYGNEPAQKWFATMDAQVITHIATAPEKYVLVRDFGDPPQLERVIEWTNTAARVAKKYRSLSKILRSMPVPSSISPEQGSSANVDFFRQSLANWYDDSASVLEEYIKPRPPAKTQEELDDQLRHLRQRSENVKLTYTHLAEMDSNLRQHLHVPTARYDDAVMKYVTNKPN
jgi:hypothetical protein